VANIDNLKPRTDLSSEEAKKMGSKGGIASVKARKEKKLFKEEIERQLGSSLEAIVQAAIDKAKDGDIRAAEFLRDTSGQGIVNKIELTEIPIIKDDL